MLKLNSSPAVLEVLGAPLKVGRESQAVMLKLAYITSVCGERLMCVEHWVPSTLGCTRAVVACSWFMQGSDLRASVLMGGGLYVSRKSYKPKVRAIEFETGCWQDCLSVLTSQSVCDKAG
jgi:hypothetical protein